MTRKALRKRRRRQEVRRPLPSTAGSLSPSWVTVSALVAATAVAMPAAAASRRFSDPRLALIAAEYNAQQDPVAAPTGAARRFDIAAGPLGDVVANFQGLTGVNVTLQPASLGAIQSPGVSGTLTVEQALAAMTAGTGIRFRITSPTTAVLDLDPLAESVDVTGQLAVIESPKYAEPLRNIPQTIEVIPRAAMEQQGVRTLSEALRNVPGITMQAGEGGGASNTAGDMFNMRGFNAANSLFVDNVRDDGLISRDVYNLEQVEVFMGPTGSDVGRGTASGYINMQTKVPHLPPVMSGAFTYGSATQLRATVDVNVPLSLRQDGGWITKSAVRMNALWQDSGVPGRYEVEQSSKAFAPSVALGIDTSTRVILAGQMMRQDNLPDYGIPGAAWAEEPLAPTTQQAPQPVDQANFYGSSNGFDYDDASQNNLLARVEHDISPRMRFRNQARYNEAHRQAVITAIQNPAAYNPDTDLVTLARQGNERDNSIFSNQTNLNNEFVTGSVEHSANVGIEFIHESQFAPTLTGLGTRAPVNIYTPNPNDPVTGYNPARTGAESDGSTNTVALYGFDTLDLSSRWQLTGGIRWEYYNTTFRAIDATGAVTTDEKGSDGLFSGKAGLVFKATEQGNLYVSYGSTATPPGGANFTLSSQPNNQNNPNVDPQISTNLEGGAKWDLANGRLSLTGALFHTKNRNVIFTVDAAAVPPVFNQDDGQTVNGVTLGAAGRIVPRLQVMASFSYLDSELDSQLAVNDGNRLTLTPEFSGNFWATFQFPAGVTVGGGVRATSEVFINAANTIRSPGYQVIDGLIEYAVNENLSFRLNLYNLTDELYIRSVNNNGGRYNPGYPRSALFTTAVGF